MLVLIPVRMLALAALAISRVGVALHSKRTILVACFQQFIAF
jgi:hypothetical protein